MIFIQVFCNKLHCVPFENRVDIVSVFKRCVQSAKGAFVQIFGDDYLPCGLVGAIPFSLYFIH